MDLKWYHLYENGNPTTDPWGGTYLLEASRYDHLRVYWERSDANLELRRIDDPMVSLVEQIKAYARGHYDVGGWDVVVECWESEGIAEALELLNDLGMYASNIEQALKHSVLSTCVSIWADQQADARNSAF